MTRKGCCILIVDLEINKTTIKRYYNMITTKSDENTQLLCLFGRLPHQIIQKQVDSSTGIPELAKGHEKRHFVIDF